MNPDLESILSADEGARARIEAARRNADARIAGARQELARLRERRAADRTAELENRVRAIAEEAERQVVERRQRREEYLKSLRQAAQGLLPAAAEAWVRIVRDGPQGRAR